MQWVVSQIRKLVAVAVRLVTVTFLIYQANLTTKVSGTRSGLLITAIFSVLLMQTITRIKKGLAGPF